MLRTYSRFLNILERIIRVLLGVVIALMVLTMFYQVIMRYIFSNSQRWCEELACYLCCYAVFLGAPLAARKSSHLQVDFLTNLYKPKMRCLAVAVCTLLSIVFLAFLLKYGLSLCAQAPAKSSTLPIRMSTVYLCIPMGCILMILFCLEVVIKNFIGFLHNGVMEETEETK